MDANQTGIGGGRIPVALVFAFMLQSAGALFWVGSAAERLTVLERNQAADRESVSQVAVIEEQVRAIRTSLDRIESKLDGAAPAQHTK